MHIHKTESEFLLQIFLQHFSLLRNHNKRHRQLMKGKEKPPRKVTASQVAERAGVSKYMVSRAYTPGAYVSAEKRDLIRQAAEELGYRPNLLARSLSKQASHIVGVVVDDFQNQNLLIILNEVTGQLQRHGYSTMLLNVTDEDTVETALRQADQFQIDGIIFLGTSNMAERFASLLQELKHIPLVVLYRDSDLPQVKVVDTDNYRGGREVAGLLAGEGYSRIGYLAGPAPGLTRLDRQAGFRDGLADLGLNLSTVLKVGNYSQHQARILIRDYLAQTDPDQIVEALFCENDMLAIGAIDALKEARREIAIVGYDGVPAGDSYTYQLSSYRQPVEVLAREAVKSIADREMPIGKFMAPGELIVRRSHKRGWLHGNA